MFFFRFPDDVYDRFWVPFNFGQWTSISTTLEIKSDDNDNFQLGSGVMGTAAVQINKNESLRFQWESEDETTQYHIYMHFAEVENLQPNQTRGFNITYNGQYMYGPFSPRYLITSTIYTTKPIPIQNQPTKTHQFSIVPVENSTLPPILNAMESYIVIDLSQLASNQGDGICLYFSFPLDRLFSSRAILDSHFLKMSIQIGL